MKKILFVASEAVPFIKTGGLADVVGSLPKCFDKEFFDVRVMIPKYLCIPEKWRSQMNARYCCYESGCRLSDWHARFCQLLRQSQNE